MRNQQNIDRFTLAFHERAVARLRENGELLCRARDMIDRWRAQRGATASDPYFDKWRVLLDQGPDAIERSVCVDSDQAATLRGVSPLGFVLSPGERHALHKRSRV